MDIKGQTVSFREIPNFYKLPLEQATHIIYNELIPVCERKNILLSQDGNLNGISSCRDTTRYEKDKSAQNLFNVRRIQKAFSSIPDIVQNTSQYGKRTSYGLKHDVERHPTQKEYITNGDWIAAMLLKGYKARFGKKTEPTSINAEFQVKLRKQTR